MKATTEKAFEAYIQETMSTRGWMEFKRCRPYKQNPSDHARMEKMVAPAVDRFIPYSTPVLQN